MKKTQKSQTSKVGLDDLGGLCGPGWIGAAVTGAEAPARGRRSGRFCLKKLPDQTPVARDGSPARRGLLNTLKITHFGAKA